MKYIVVAISGDMLGVTHVGSFNAEEEAINCVAEMTKKYYRENTFGDMFCPNEVIRYRVVEMKGEENNDED